MKTDAKNWRVGLSTICNSHVDEATFRAYAENHIDDMEISLQTEDYANIDYKKLAWLSEEYRVNLWSYHLPFYRGTDVACTDNEERAANTEKLKQYIRLAAGAGIHTAVLHPCVEPVMSSNRRDRIKCAVETLAVLAEFAATFGVTIAVENLPRTCLGNRSVELAELIAGNDKLRVCFDTNHLLLEKNVDFVRALGSKIHTLHVSDYDFCNERHWLPGEGKNNWTEIIDALCETGYHGPVMYEVAFDDQSTITRDRALTANDFYENYRLLTAGMPPKVYGTPKPDACKNKNYYENPMF